MKSQLVDVALLNPIHLMYLTIYLFICLFILFIYYINENKNFQKHINVRLKTKACITEFGFQILQYFP